MIYLYKFQFDFWKAPSVANATVDVMTYPGFLNKLSRLLDNSGINYRIVLDDVAE